MTENPKCLNKKVNKCYCGNEYCVATWYCFNIWSIKVEKVIDKIFIKYNFSEINLKYYILSYINNGKI